jgi:glycosyltransferase involved in cell wall biosynthesis
MLPRVGIDGFNLAIPRGTGVATYARALSHALGGLGHQVDALYGLDIPAEADPALGEVLFFDLLESERTRKAPKYPSAGWAAQMIGAARGLDAHEIALAGRTIATPLAPRLPHHDRILNVRDLFGLAGRYFRNFGRFLTVRVPDPPRIMHWTYPIPVRVRGAINLYTIHDLVPLRMPYTTLDNKTNHVRLLEACFRHGDHIVTVSETSRRDILDFFPKLAPERVTNTYQAITPPARPVDEAEVARLVGGAFGLQPRGYFLFFGSIEPKKNVGRLLEAYLGSDIALPLVIVGARAWKSEQELALLKHRPPDDPRIRQIDYVPPDVLATLIAGARATVFPSLYEGFGLPVLEAMSLGTPVLTSTGGALPEIAGDAALLVDPYDPRAIAAGLQRLAEEDGGTLRAELAARGRVRAAEFGMAQYRDRIAALYRAIQAPLINNATNPARRRFAD